MARTSTYRTTPLYANGRLFTVATTRRIAAAIDPENGETLWMWRMNEGIRWQKAPRQFAGRGPAYWTDGASERVIVATPGYHLASLDAKTGLPDPKFGKNGIVDLMDGLGFPLVPLAVDDSGPLVISDAAPARKARPGETWNEATKTGADGTVGIDPAHGQIGISCPPIVVNDVIIVGNSHIHGYYPIRLSNLPSYVRGFDVRTGKTAVEVQPCAGAWRVRRRHMAERDQARNAGRGEGERLGDLFSRPGAGPGLHPGRHAADGRVWRTSAREQSLWQQPRRARREDGQRKWHFQMVHHDIWDYDAPMAPNLLDVTIAGKPRKIIAQSSKQGWLYVFDRVTGEPIWPIVETPVLSSEVPGELAAPTQPIPSQPAPYAQQGLVEADLIDYTPAIKDAALKLAKACRMGPYYIPASPGDGTAPSGMTCSWYAPGASGGVNIDGGAAVDPETGLLYVAAQNGLSTMQLLKDPCSEFRYSSPHDSCGQLGALPPPPGYQKSDGRGGGRTAAANNIGGVSIVKPKELGGITAYDMSSGDKAWWIPNGGQLLPVETKDPLFAGVTLPPAAPGRGHAQIITTQKPGDLWHRAEWRSAEREAADLRRRQGVGEARGRGRHPVAHERGADDVHAQRAAVHRVCDRSGRKHVARRAESAEVACFVRAALRRSCEAAGNRGEHHV